MLFLKKRRNENETTMRYSRSRRGTDDVYV
jgi:hypothetical protein